MPANLPASTITQKNSDTNKPIWLYRIYTDPDGIYESLPSGEPSGSVSLYLAGNNEDVDYYRTDGGVDTPQTYTAFPIRHEGLSRNSNGQIDDFTITVSNVTREIEAYIQNRNGLKGHKVVIRCVFLDDLGAADKHREAVFYITGVTSNAKAASFTLKSRLDILKAQLPNRKFLRRCSWDYKGLGCWEEDGAGGFQEPTNFSASRQLLLPKDVSFDDTGSSISIQENWQAFLIPGLNLSADTFYITIRTNSAGFVAGQPLTIKLSSDSDGANNYILETISNIGTYLTDDTFTEIGLPLSGWTETGTLNLRDIKRIEVAMAATNNSAAKIEFKNPEIAVAQQSSWATTAVDSCNKTLTDCRRHNNVQRFGGFPGVPSRRNYR